LNSLAKGSKGGRFPLLYLNNSIRYDDSSLQRLLSAVEEAQTLTALLLAVWPLARVLALHVVEYVLAERARHPTSWPVAMSWKVADVLSDRIMHGRRPEFIEELLREFRPQRSTVLQCCPEMLWHCPYSILCEQGLLGR
jgi:hypothetical protein